jgi:beta-xylosidase
LTLIQLFFDDDDKVYLSTALRVPLGERRPTKLDCIAVFGNEIDITTGRNISRPILLRKPSTTIVSEGSHIVKKDGLYYLFTADGGTGDLHQVWVSRSTSPMGPYEAGPDCPIVFNDQDSLVRTTGHMDVVQDESGGWWGVLLATRPQTDSKGVLLESHLGRETFLVPMVWPKDGWPVVNDRKTVSTVGSVVSGSIAQQDPVRPWRDDFDQGMSRRPDIRRSCSSSPHTYAYSSGLILTETLSPGWYHLRTPLKQDWDLKSRRLTLYGNPYTIDQQECPAALFRKQTAFTGTWTTEIDFVPDHPSEEAGTTVYRSKYAFMAAGLRRSEKGDGRYAFLRWCDPDTGEHQVRYDIHNEKFYLRHGVELNKGLSGLSDRRNVGT